MAVSEPALPAPEAGHTGRWLARLMRSEGVDLLSVTTEELRRGTPVFVDAAADVVEVQHVMARSHIRVVPVLDDDGFAGVVDLVELAERGDLQAGTPVSHYVQSDAAAAVSAATLALDPGSAGVIELGADAAPRD